MQDTDESDSGVVSPLRLRWVDVAIIGVELTRRMLGALHDACVDLTTVLAGHANYDLMRKQFASQVAADLETLTQPPKD